MVIDRSRISVKEVNDSRLELTKYSDLYETVHPSLDFVSSIVCTRWTGIRERPIGENYEIKQQFFAKLRHNTSPSNGRNEILNLTNHCSIQKKTTYNSTWTINVLSSITCNSNLPASLLSFSMFMTCELDSKVYNRKISGAHF